MFLHEETSLGKGVIFNFNFIIVCEGFHLTIKIFLAAVRSEKKVLSHPDR